MTGLGWVARVVRSYHGGFRHEPLICWLVCCLAGNTAEPAWWKKDSAMSLEPCLNSPCPPVRRRPLRASHGEASLSLAQRPTSTR